MKSRKYWFNPNLTHYGGSFLGVAEVGLARDLGSRDGGSNPSTQTKAMQGPGKGLANHSPSREFARVTWTRSDSQVRGLSANGNTSRLHREIKGSTPLASTKSFRRPMVKDIRLIHGKRKFDSFRKDQCSVVVCIWDAATLST